MRSRLLMPHEDVAQEGVLGERMVERHDRAAGIPEQHVHTLLEEDAAHELGAGEHLGQGGQTPQ